MNTKKISAILKTAAEYFTTSAGTASLIIGLVAFAVIVPPFVSIPIIGGVGLLFAAAGAYRKWLHIDMEEAHEQRREEEKDEVLAISRTLDKRVAEIVAVERKIEAKLEIPVAAEKPHTDPKPVPEHKPVEPEVEPVSDDEHDAHAYTQTVVLPAVTAATPVHQLPKVTIRISNLPTFFTVDHHSGAHPAGLHATEPHHDEHHDHSASKRNMVCSS